MSLHYKLKLQIYIINKYSTNYITYKSEFNIPTWNQFKVRIKYHDLTFSLLFKKLELSFIFL